MFAYVLITSGGAGPDLPRGRTVDWRPIVAGLIAAAAMIATYISNITLPRPGRST
jgi:hypothetical protein